MGGILEIERYCPCHGRLDRLQEKEKPHPQFLPISIAGVLIWEESGEEHPIIPTLSGPFSSVQLCIYCTDSSPSSMVVGEDGGTMHIGCICTVSSARSIRTSTIDSSIKPIHKVGQMARLTPTLLVLQHEPNISRTPSLHSASLSPLLPYLLLRHRPVFWPVLKRTAHFLAKG